jgi:divalent metal cation (Fe/Co/Zn/Cd) transporter
MGDFVHIRLGVPSSAPLVLAPLKRSKAVLWLQGITLAWMLVECWISLFAAATARSPAIFAFGSDSLVELFSASVVLLQFAPRFSLSPKDATRVASVLLFLLAGNVAVIAALALTLHAHPAVSPIGIGVTIAALIAMPVLAWLKRRQAARDHNPALSADAAQSATCAYLAAVTLAGLAVNALFHVQWFDPLAALVALPLLFKEGMAAWRGTPCGCC